MVDIPSPKEKKVKFPSAEVEKKGCVYYLNSFKAPPSNHIRFTLVLLKCSSLILQQWFYIHWRTFKNLVEVCETFSAVFFSFSHTFDCRGAQSAQKCVRGRVDSLYSALRMNEQRCCSRLWRTLWCSQDAVQVSTTTNSLIVGALSWWGRRQPLLSM